MSIDLSPHEHVTNLLPFSLERLPNRLAVSTRWSTAVICKVSRAENLTSTPTVHCKQRCLAIVISSSRSIFHAILSLRDKSNRLNIFISLSMNNESHYQTAHLFTRLLPCPGVQLNTRSNSAKFDKGPSTLRKKHMRVADRSER